MNRFLVIFFLFFLVNCSFDQKTGIWTDELEIKKNDKNIKRLFATKDKLLEELNPELEIKLTSKLINNSFSYNFDNNNGRINYNGSLEKISKFKFSKIHNFDQFEAELIFDGNKIIFFDKKGSIFKFDNTNNLLWKKNYYLKSEKKTKPILSFAKNKNTLVVADSIAKYYALNIDTGDLLWSKYNSAPFNSQLKIYKDKFFVIDFENILRCYSLKSGLELWKVKTEQSFIKSQKKLTLVIIKDKLYFNNSIGDITAVDINSGSLLWQTPTQNSAIYEDAFSLKTSDLIANNESIFFSNNRNEFFSIDLKTGYLNWKQSINSNLRPSLVDNLIFSITNEGFLIIADINSGNIIRVTDIFDIFDTSKRKKIKPVGFIVGSNNIYVATNNGRLITVDIKKGKSKSLIKIDNKKISRPFVFDKNLFIIKDDSIIKFN